MAWVLKEIVERVYEQIPIPFSGECMINEDGVRIILFGRDLHDFQNIFIFEYIDIKLKFSARRSPKGWTDYGASAKERANFALGPDCVTWIDTRFMTRQLLDQEIEYIKTTITEFLTNEYRRTKHAVSPYPETVIFRGTHI